MQSGDWSEATEPTTSDWALESAEAGNWQNEEPSNEWSEQENDGMCYKTNQNYIVFRTAW